MDDDFVTVVDVGVDDAVDACFNSSWSSLLRLLLADGASVGVAAAALIMGFVSSIVRGSRGIIFRSLILYLILSYVWTRRLSCAGPCPSGEVQGIGGVFLFVIFELWDEFFG